MSHDTSRPSPRISNQGLGITLLKISAIYLLIGLGMGLVMGISNNFSLSSVHAHISLLGWATMSITGVIYIVMPACRDSKLAQAHFWGHNLGLPLMMISLMLLTQGLTAAEKALVAGSTLVIASLLAFTINVFLNGRLDQANREIDRPVPAKSVPA